MGKQSGISEFVADNTIGFLQCPDAADGYKIGTAGACADEVDFTVFFCVVGQS